MLKRRERRRPGCGCRGGALEWRGVDAEFSEHGRQRRLIGLPRVIADDETRAGGLDNDVHDLGAARELFSDVQQDIGRTAGRRCVQTDPPGDRAYNPQVQENTLLRLPRPPMAQASWKSRSSTRIRIARARVAPSTWWCSPARTKSGPSNGCLSSTTSSVPGYELLDDLDNGADPRARAGECGATECRDAVARSGLRRSPHSSHARVRKPSSSRSAMPCSAPHSLSCTAAIVSTPGRPTDRLASRPMAIAPAVSPPSPHPAGSTRCVGVGVHGVKDRGAAGRPYALDAHPVLGTAKPPQRRAQLEAARRPGRGDASPTRRGGSRGGGAWCSRTAGSKAGGGAAPPRPLLDQARKRPSGRAPREGTTGERMQCDAHGERPPARRTQHPRT